MKKILIVLLLACVITVSGCVGGGTTDVTSVVKTIPQVQEFLREYPNAEITAVLWSSSYIQSNMDKIKEDCIPAIEDKAYYKVDIQENELKMTAWVSSDDYTVVCIYKEGGEILTTTTTQETTTVNGGESGEGMPHQFYGDVTIDGGPASDGTTVISAVGEFKKSFKTYTSDGKYSLIIKDPDKEMSGGEIVFYVDGGLVEKTANFCNGCVDKLDLSIEIRVDCSLAAIELINDRVYVNTEDKTFSLGLSNTGALDLTGLKVIFFNDTSAGICTPSPQTHIESGEIEALSSNFCEEMPDGGINKVRITTVTCPGVKAETTNIIEESNVQCQYANLQVETAVYDDSEDKIVAVVWNMGKQELSNFEFLVYYSEENMVTLTPEDADIVLSEEEWHTFTVEDVISTPVKIQVRSSDCPRESIFTCIYSSGKFNC